MSYFFEIWLRGFAKDYLRRVSVVDTETFHPHITLVRPFEIKTSGGEEAIRWVVTDFCERFDPIGFSIDGVSSFNKKIAYARVTNEQELLEFNDGLEKILEPHVVFAPKLAQTKVLHATIQPKKPDIVVPRIDQYMLRLTGLRDKTIWFSYDFVMQRALSREESLDQTKWYKTVHDFTLKSGLLPTRNGYKPIVAQD